MKIKSGRTVSFILCVLISGTIAVAGQKGKETGKDPQPGNKKGVSAHVGVDIFVGDDRELIRRHYLTSQGKMPPGLAKRSGDLPPGLEKQLRRNGHLPPGLEKKLYPFPVELEQRLPPLREGLVRGMIGVHAVIMDKRTSVIVDVFSLF